MNKFTKISPVIFFALILGGIVYSYVKFQYNDVYSLSLNGRIRNMRTDIKEALYVTITPSNSEHVFLKYYWPKFHKYAEVGDSVYKAPKDYTITLIKANTNKKIDCEFHASSQEQ